MFLIKQMIKMFLQNMLLPLFYAWYARKPIEKGLILFADAHHDEIPFSMRRMYEEVSKIADMHGKVSETTDMHEETSETASTSYQIKVCVKDFNKMSYGELLKYLVWFMKQYAAAEYVFICDYYLPAAACRKRPETTLVQLWHSCGLMKKIAYDTGQDIPKGYHGNMFGNYTYLTLSAQVCVPVHARALQIPEQRIRATGVSRTDYYFDESWNRRCREAFYGQYPQAQGKKVAVWAPTFRGNAAMPTLEGLQEIRQAADALSEDWYFIIKAHPHVDAHQMTSNCRIPTEELLPVADLLITDYSSVLFDFLIYQKPVVLFAPDLEDYENNRGFYLDYRELPYPIAQTRDELEEAIKNWTMPEGDMATAGMEPENQAAADMKSENRDAADMESENRGVERHGMQQMQTIAQFRETYVGACDGHATKRILEMIGLRREDA